MSTPSPAGGNGEGGNEVVSEKRLMQTFAKNQNQGMQF
jgi:hypothetical protein